MAAFFRYSCLWNHCGKNCSSLLDLIDHIEAVHIEKDPRILEKQEAAQPAAVPLSYVNCFFSEATRSAHRKMKEIGSEADSSFDLDYTPKKKKALSAYTVNSCIATPEASENGDDDGNMSDNSDDSWTTSDGLTSELILNSVTMEDGDSKRYICPVKGCGKKYKNPNGIKYHAKNGHCKDGKTKKPHKCHCGKSYKNQSGLRHHIATRHSTIHSQNITESHGNGIEVYV